MPTGRNTTNTFADSMDDIRAAARAVREYANVMGQVVDTRKLENNTGLNWKELSFAKLTAMNLDELSDLEQNPQEILDTLFSVSPTLVGMSVFITDRSKVRMSKHGAAKIGVLTENAMARKKDLDLIAGAQSATTDLGTTGNPMASDLISAAASRISGNATEPWIGPVAAVMRGFQLKDIQDEAVSGFGTYPVSGGIAEDTLRKGFSGDLFGVKIYRDDNIPVDSSSDAVAVVFASGPESALVLVQGMESRRVTERKENIGGGAEIMYATDEYGTGIRQQAWIYAITADSTAPVG